MAARLVWVAQCEVCDQTREFDGSLTVEQLGDAMRAAGWSLPMYGGTFCAGCAAAVRRLSGR